MPDISKFLKRASDSIERQNYDLAIFNYKQALMLTPDNLDAREKLRATQGRRYLESGVSPFVATLKGLFSCGMAIVMNLLGKTAPALEHIENAITANPENLFFLKQLIAIADKAEMDGLVLWQRGEIIRRIDPENVDLILAQADAYAEIGDGKTAVKLYERAKEIDPDVDVDHLINRTEAQNASQIFEQGAHQGAHTIVASQEGTEKLEAESHIARTDEERLKKVEHIQHELDERPDDYRLFVRIAAEYFNFDDFTLGYEQGMAALQQAKKLMPSDTNINVKMGDMEIKRLRIAARAAKAEFERARNSETAKKQYVDAIHELKVFQIKEYEERVHAQPLIAAYHHELGKLYKDAKTYEKAIAEFQQSSKDPKLAISSFTELGQCFVEIGQIESGIDMFRKAMVGQELFHKIRDTIYFLGDAYERLGEYAEAQKLFTQILQDDINYRDVGERVERMRTKIRQNSN